MQFFFFFFLQAEDGIRDLTVTGVQTCALPISQWLNPAAFAQPAFGSFGTSGRNAYEGPGARVVDLSLVRAFRFLDTHRLEARVEAFNALNWFRWGNPTTNLSSANFGRILTAGDLRIMQFAMKYQF